MFLCEGPGNGNVCRDVTLTSARISYSTSRTLMLSENFWHFFDVRIMKIKLCNVYACMVIKR